MHAGGSRHAFRDNGVDALGRGFDRQPERHGDCLQRLARGRNIEPHLATQKERRIIETKHEIGVGDSRLRAAIAVARRSWRRARRVRPDAQQTDFIGARNRATAGADFDHVDDRRLDRQARTAGKAVHPRGLHHWRDLCAAVLDETGLGGRPAHVERDHIRLTSEPPKQRRRQAATGGARFQQSDRHRRGRLRRDQPATRVHQTQIACKTAFAQITAKSRNVARHQRLHVGIGAGCYAALVFAELSDDIARQRRGQLRMPLTRESCHAAFVCVIGIRVQEADRHRLDAR